MNRRITETDINFSTVAALDHLEARVKAQLFGRVRDLRLLIRGEGLVLQGRAQTYYAKQLAQHALMDGTGLHLVANEIEVCEPAPGPSSFKQKYT